MALNEAFEVWRAAPTEANYEGLGWEMLNFARAVVAKSGAYRGNFDDLVQVAVVAGLDQMGNFEGRSSFKTWFYRVIAGEISRSKDPRTKAVQQQQATQALENEPPDPHALMEARELLTQAERNLEKEDLDIVNLALQGYTRREIAAVMNLDPIRVKYRMTVVREVLGDSGRDIKV